MKRLIKIFICSLLIGSFALFGCEEEPDQNSGSPLTYFEIFNIVNENVETVHSNYLVNAEIETFIYDGDESSPSQILSISYTNKYDGKNLYIYEETITVGQDNAGNTASTTLLIENTYYEDKRYVSYVSNETGETVAEETVVPSSGIPDNSLVDLSLPLTNSDFANARYSEEAGRKVLIIPATIEICAIVTTTMLPSLNLGISANANAYDGTLQYIYDDSYNFVGVILDTHIHLDDGSGLAYDFIFKLELEEYGGIIIENPEK